MRFIFLSNCVSLIKKIISPMFDKFSRTIAFWISAFVSMIILVGLFILPVFLYFGNDLPDYHQLVEYDPPTISRLFSSEGDLIAELAVERRIFKSIDEIPPLVKNAFIAAEDQNYYDHPGIDLMSIVRAATQNILNMGTDKHPVGGSTITQQVVKNFLLTNEKSISRKIKEAILAYRINKVYSKDRILELYLNQIYLGNSAYGVTSAAMNYFSKDLKDLKVEEAALLAAMPKAPSSLDPTKHRERTKVRRDWVIDRMHEESFITLEQANAAKSSDIKLTTKYDSTFLDNGYYTESVRLQLIDKYGNDYVYKEGITVHTNVNKKLQKMADDALRQGLIEYDRKHGFRGPLANLPYKGDDWQLTLKNYAKPPVAGHWKLAIVLKSTVESAAIGLEDGSKGAISLASLAWARKTLPEQYLGKKIEAASEVLKSGDIILVSSDAKEGYLLEQIPEVNGAIVVMQPKTGKVLALSGGYSFKDSKYNRAIQAVRQPGSVFKPFVYLAALEAGYSPFTIVPDEPIALSQGPGLPAWTPKNIDKKFMGNITLRTALEKSRNLATVRLLAAVGVDPVAEVATRLNVYKNPPKLYSMALGAYESTLLDLTNAFAIFASNGVKVTPKLISHIFDRKGNLIFNSDERKCSTCQGDSETSFVPSAEQVPTLDYQQEQLIDPVLNYQLVSILEGAVTRGTAVRARSIKKHLAGKTGTSNESKDTWFVGFSPEIVCGVFVGFDAPKSLGAKEQGASVALPIFVNFMKNALDEVDDKEFEIPKGINFVEIDSSTGQKASVFAGKNAVLEAVKPAELEKILNAEMSELPENNIEIKDIESEPDEVY